MSQTPPHILLVDDEPDILELMSMTLSRQGCDTNQAADVANAKQLLQSNRYDACLTDLRLPDGTGIEIVEYIQRTIPTMPVAVISAHGNMETAIEALKAGAFDFISKPIELERLRDLVDTALAFNARNQRQEQTRQFLGSSPAIEEIRGKISKLTRSMAPVHITGESGTGKELVAHLIHAHGPHAEKPFIAVNCSAIPEELMESEFFGHVRGSFTGAHTDKEGLFRAAEGGTLFLDEIADLPLSMQSKLLRAIQERAIRPVGAHEEIPVHCRILSATHRNLHERVETGKFREDLYYRVNVIGLEVPPLRERREDIPLLAQKILSNVVSRNSLGRRQLDDQVLERLCRYDYPGNIRELENILERAAALSEESISVDDLDLPEGKQTKGSKPVMDSSESLDDYMQRIERQRIVEALEESGQNKTRAAERLGISFRSMRYKLKKLGMTSGNGPDTEE